MQITETSNCVKGPTVIFIDRGIRGEAQVVVAATEMPSVRTFNHDRIPALIAPYLTVRFSSLHINGKDYSDSHASYSPERSTHPTRQRNVLTDSGIQPVGYRAHINNTGFTDNAHAKICTLLPLLADRYFTADASKAALLSYADTRIAAAQKALDAAQESLAAARHKHQSIANLTPPKGKSS